jgi:hypothetical protein
MTRWERRLFNGLNVVVAATGFLYFYMKHMMTTNDPFAVVNHAWEPGMIAAHVVAAPLVILLFGIVLRSHILKMLLSNVRGARRSGWFSLVSFSVMAFSGYLLQVVSNPTWLRVLVVAHVSTSTVFVLGYGSHLVVGWRLLRTSADTGVVDPTLPRAARLPL